MIMELLVKRHGLRSHALLLLYCFHIHFIDDSNAQNSCLNDFCICSCFFCCGTVQLRYVIKHIHLIISGTCLDHVWSIVPRVRSSIKFTPQKQSCSLHHTQNASRVRSRCVSDTFKHYLVSELYHNCLCVT